jgi:hypothetical protein
MAAISIFAVGAVAEPVDVDRFTEDQLEKLPPEQMKALPWLKVARELGPETGRGAKAFLPLMLRKLEYGFQEAFTGSDEQIDRWVKQFQGDLGEPATGTITVGQWETLSKRVEALDGKYVGLPASLYIRVTDEFASAEGTWVIEGDQIAYPLNFTKYQCFRRAGYCTRVDTYIDDKTWTSLESQSL